MAAPPAPAPIPAIGEVQVDPDGVISGWCFSPARPEARLTVEILINETLATTVVASRFLEELRNRGIGDGYHGFSVTLTRQLNRMGHTGIVSLREQESGYTFWHWVRGDFSLPAGFEVRLAAARAQIAGLAARLATPAPLPLGPAFAALGRHLTGATTAERAAALPAVPAYSLVAPAAAGGMCPDAAALVLFGTTAIDAMAARRSQNYVHLPGRPPAARWRLALAAADGAHLVLCDGDLPSAIALAALPAGIVIPADIGAALQRLAPSLQTRHLPQGEAAGILLAAPRAAYEALGGLAPDFDDGGTLAIADFALRAAEAGHAINVTDAPGAAAPATAQAANAFLTRWRAVVA